MTKADYWVHISEKAQLLLQEFHSLNWRQIFGRYKRKSSVIEYGRIVPSITVSYMDKKEMQNKAYVVNYSIFPFYWSDLLLASIGDKICFLGFLDDLSEREVLFELKKSFPTATLIECKSDMHQSLVDAMCTLKPTSVTIPLLLIGTSFQLRVWKEMANLKEGVYLSYSELAQKIGQDKAFRAVGSAVGKNPIALLIPCHQILQERGGIGGYRWGIMSKLTLLLGQTGIYE